MSLQLTQLIGFGAGGVTDAAVEYLGTAAAAIGTGTFTSQPFGTEASNRYIVVGITIHGTGAGLPTAVSIGGSSATLITATATGTQSNCRFALLNVPTGTSGTIAVTTNGGQDISIMIWRVTWLNSATPTDTASTTNAYPDLTTSTLDITSGGIALGIVAGNDTANDGSADWSWVGLTENVEGFADGGVDKSYSGASLAFANAAANRTITATKVHNDSRDAYLVASWR